MSSSQIEIEPLYVVDTHALIWHLTDANRLGREAARVFAAAERGEARLLVSAIVIAELYYADKKFGLFASFEEVFLWLQTSSFIRLISLDAAHVLDFAVDGDVPEMHDRIIAGLARRLSAPLLTSDARIVASNLVSVVWD